MAGDRPRDDLRPLAAAQIPQGQSLGGRLILFATLLTLVTVALSLIALSIVVRRQTRVHLVELLAQNQGNARDLQERSFRDLLWMSALVSQSPTLRAALDTYRSESTRGSDHRADLLATVSVEVSNLREMVSKDIAIVTDERGSVLAVDPPSGPLPMAGASMSGKPWIASVLNTPEGDVRPAFGVMRSGDEYLHVGAVPILLQGFVIGTLTLGDRIDAAWFSGLQEALRTDVALVIDGRVTGSSAGSGTLGPGLYKEWRDAAAVDSRPAELTSIDGEEHLVVQMSLGADDQGNPALLLLLQSLTRALQPVQRSLLIALLFTGALSVLLAGLAAWRISRSILHPFERFISFVRSVASRRDASLRFDATGLTTETRFLNEAFSDLLTALQAREQQIMEQQREELIRVERLKESEKLASLGRMLSSAAHEINNPLTAVLGQVDLALAAGPLDEKIQSRLASARKEGHRIAGLVKTLLKVAHRDTGERRMVDVHHLLRETIDLRQHEYSGAGVGMRFTACEDSALIQANELELQQVFLNIINNALDALREVKGSPVLTIRTRLEKNSIVISFTDNGPGMKDPRKVFDHFYTTKEVGKGTGLGLSITHAIVQSHGGAIVAENLPAGGACFTITLPLTHKARSQAAPLEKPAAAAAIRLTSALVVDDEPGVLEYQMEILRSLGAAPIGAGSGREAMEWIGRQRFDVIISDLKMPGGISGADLFGWAERTHPAQASRFVFVTGDTANESTREFLRQSGRPFLMKPFELEDYLHVLTTAQSVS